MAAYDGEGPEREIDVAFLDSFVCLPALLLYLTFPFVGTNRGGQWIK